MMFCSGFPSTDPNRFLLVAKNIKDHHMFRRSKVSSRKIPLSHKLARRYLPRKHARANESPTQYLHCSKATFLGKVFSHAGAPTRTGTLHLQELHLAQP